MFDNYKSMKKSLAAALLSFLISSCFKTDVRQYESWNQDPLTKASGYQVNRLPKQYNSFSGARFLSKYDDTMWADTDNYYSDFSDIRFERSGPVFISFFNINNDVSYCNGWKGDENVYDGIKWNITFKTNEEDVLWFDYDYYGTGQEIEYTITYKYEVIDGLLHFSNSEGQEFIFNPSDKIYKRELIDTDEIIEQEGCLFL